MWVGGLSRGFAGNDSPPVKKSAHAMKILQHESTLLSLPFVCTKRPEKTVLLIRDNSVMIISVSAVSLSRRHGVAWAVSQPPLFLVTSGVPSPTAKSGAPNHGALDCLLMHTYKTRLKGSRQARRARQAGLWQPVAGLVRNTGCGTASSAREAGGFLFAFSKT